MGCRTGQRNPVTQFKNYIKILNNTDYCNPFFLLFIQKAVNHMGSIDIHPSSWESYQKHFRILGNFSSYQNLLHISS